MFERFTGDSRTAVTMAQEEARMLRHGEVDTGHLMLGLLTSGPDGPVAGGPGARALRSLGLTSEVLRPLVGREIDGLDPDALAAIGIDLDAVRQATEASFGPGALEGRTGPVKSGHLKFTSEAKKTLELSLRVAIKNKQRFICDGHILLALLMLPDSTATRALRAAQTDLDALKEAAEREIAAIAA
ncbi:Clp protease N-terminal domain-containing protein [Actinocorallia sp. A-T 12471]|uniref:Clp protease N-terminal domain-containing protein n=1 Tax=Actinocorallia sp. A-T 12471 TaxID=3089813 RepID=UPI0029CBE370|nr:Clp protease N-terminal domain-containing protein [Actinocorallia sp. A-T 12471]MDX6742063.1 Clp protease N-terminal domain-containing protein [Actinocorallia sp. A-T 12471]